jgi:hypothetical protein
VISQGTLLCLQLNPGLTVLPSTVIDLAGFRTLSVLACPSVVFGVTSSGAVVAFGLVLRAGASFESVLVEASVED